MHSFAALAVPEHTLGIHWFGQSSFALKDSAGIIVQVDPYFPHTRPAERFIHAEPPLDEATLPTDYVLLTHVDSDHTCVESLLRIHQAFPAACFVGPVESVRAMVEAGIPAGQTVLITAGQAVALGSMRVFAVYSKPPQGAPEDGIPAPRVEHLGYVVEGNGVRAYITGDPLHTFGEHDELVEPVAALRPDVGMLTTHPDEGEFPFFDGCVKMALRIGLKAVIPSHYQCFVRRTYDPQEWAAHFPGDGPEPIIMPYNTHIIYAPEKSLPR